MEVELSNGYGVSRGSANSIRIHIESLAKVLEELYQLSEDWGSVSTRCAIVYADEIWHRYSLLLSIMDGVIFVYDHDSHPYDFMMIIICVFGNLLYKYRWHFNFTPESAFYNYRPATFVGYKFSFIVRKPTDLTAEDPEFVRGRRYWRLSQRRKLITNLVGQLAPELQLWLAVLREPMFMYMRYGRAV